VKMKLRVAAGAKKFSVSQRNGEFVVRLTQQAREGKANEELLERLRKIVGAKAFLVRGAKSREKEVAFEGVSDEEAVKKITALAQSV